MSLKERPLRIALCASTFLPRIGGAEIAAHNLARGLQLRGHEPVVLTWYGQARRIKHVVPYPVHGFLPRSFGPCSMNRLVSGRAFMNYLAPQMIYYQARYRFDVWNVHHGWPLALLCRSVASRLNIPWVVTPQGDDVLCDHRSHMRLLESKHVYKAMQSSLTSASRVTSTSAAMRNAIVAMGVQGGKIDDIPNGVHVERFAPTANRRNQTRGKYGLDSCTSLILSVGRNHPQKGYDLLPFVAKRLLQAKASFKWMIVGEGAEDILANVPESIRKHIIPLPPIMGSDEDAGGYDCIPSQDLIDVYCASDCFVLLSRNEPFGMVVAEAMAAGLPVVGTTGMGAPDMIVSGHNGFIVEKEDVDALAVKILLIIGDTSLRNAMGHASRSLAEQYDWSRIVSLYVDSYVRAMNQE